MKIFYCCKGVEKEEYAIAPVREDRPDDRAGSAVCGGRGLSGRPHGERRAGERRYPAVRRFRVRIAEGSF